MDKGLDLLLQGEEVLHIMFLLLMEVAVCYEILLSLFAHLSKPIGNILILYFHQDLY